MLQLQVNVIRSVCFTVDIFDDHLADKVLIKFRSRLHLDPEAVIDAHRIHLIAGSFPFIKGQHVSFAVTARCIGYTSGIDKCLIIGDVDGGLASSPCAAGSGSDIKDCSLSFSCHVSGTDHNFFIAAPVHVHKLVPRSKVTAYRPVNAFIAILFRLHTCQGGLRLLHIR